jgi:hypothetical protein
MQIDFESLFKDYSIQYTQSGKNSQNGWINIKCPMCSDHSDHGGFNLTESYYHCWRCGFHPYEKILSVLLHFGYLQVKDIVKSYSGKTGNRQKFITESQTSFRNTAIKKIVPPGEELTGMHLKYLKKRKFDPKYIKAKYKVTGTDFIGAYKTKDYIEYFNYRLIIPVIVHNEIVSFLGRDVTGLQEQRYKNLSIANSIISPKNVLYNIDNCQANWIAVVEGVFDVWRMGDNFCSTLGTSVTDYQLKALAMYDKIYIVFDSEKEAQAKAEKCAYSLSALGKEVYVVDIETSKDPAELTDVEAAIIKRKILAL